MDSVIDIREVQLAVTTVKNLLRVFNFFFCH